MNRTDVINEMIKRTGATRYLEVGIRRAACNYGLIQCEEKTGIDSRYCDDSPGLLRQDSDTFFNVTANKFDVIFIDGDHHYSQCRRDVLNALKHLRKGGAIIMHDCLPATEEEMAPDQNGGRPWCGQCWQVYCEMKQRRDLKCFIVDCDYGVGVIRRGKPKDPLAATPRSPIDAKARREMGAITPRQFLEVTA